MFGKPKWLLASFVQNFLNSVLSDGDYGSKVLLAEEVCGHLFYKDEIDRCIGRIASGTGQNDLPEIVDVLLG